MPEKCACGSEPEVREVKTVAYMVVCRCGQHGDALGHLDWAIRDWDGKRKVARAVGDATWHKREGE